MKFEKMKNKRRFIILLSTVTVLGLMSFGMVYGKGSVSNQKKNEVFGNMENLTEINMELDKVNMEQEEKVEKEYSKALERALELLSIPEGYTLKDVQSQKQNKADVWVFRYEKASGQNNGLNGEHYSFVVDKNNNKILGFTWMDEKFSTGELPSKEETKAIAKAFLDKVEPGMFAKLKNLWIDKHDEVIAVKDEKYNESVNLTISGMKYKCYLAEQDNYAWVIVGPGGNVITFEQGIIWNNGRVTEKWLHDSWLKNK
ncbi:YcdB/YcdC domain-containing protein [Paenibacillus sp. S-38]|uniref:YcdB/YcdC domain-containing protein n=1 Tax=Paenibacillus sp. S-38 TaxID=3416710 RepID=UPI003CEBA149